METDVACVQEGLSEEALITFFVVRGVHAAPVLDGYSIPEYTQRSRHRAETESK